MSRILSFQSIKDNQTNGLTNENEGLIQHMWLQSIRLNAMLMENIV